MILYESISFPRGSEWFAILCGFASSTPKESRGWAWMSCETTYTVCACIKSLNVIFTRPKASTNHKFSDMYNYIYIYIYIFIYIIFIYIWLGMCWFNYKFCLGVALALGKSFVFFHILFSIACSCGSTVHAPAHTRKSGKWFQKRSLVARANFTRRRTPVAYS